MAKPYAKLKTAKGEHTMSHRELDELRMLLDFTLRNDLLPRADPPIRESDYEELKSFIEENFEKERYPKETEYLSESREHRFEEGDYALDSTEPTPSPEANTVKIVELTGERADEFVIEETGNTVAEHNPFFPSDDIVVAGTYPNMGGPDKVWHFPESRLYPV